MGAECIEVVVKTDKGRVKKVNEDNFLIKVAKFNNREFGLFAICDGLGGLSNGDFASKRMVQQLEKWWNNKIQGVLNADIEDRDILIEFSIVMREVNRELINYGKENNLKLGTTASVLFVLNRKFYICHIGDSRIYTIDKEIKVLTKDHTYYNELISKGKFHEAKNVKRSILTQCIGSGIDIRPDFLVGKLPSEVLFLLCCDGFYNKMTFKDFQEMKKELYETSDYGYMGQVCNKYIQLVKGRGERDNITVLAIKYVSSKEEL
ncbi:MAG: PP2C family protein-serine/threonine phosphatase [Clostridium sp.]